MSKKDSEAALTQLGSSAFGDSNQLPSPPHTSMSMHGQLPSSPPSCQHEGGELHVSAVSPHSALTFMSDTRRESDSLEYSNSTKSRRSRSSQGVGGSREGRLQGLLSFLDRADKGVVVNREAGLLGAFDNDSDDDGDGDVGSGGIGVRGGFGGLNAQTGGNRASRGTRDSSASDLSWNGHQARGFKQSDGEKDSRLPLGQQTGGIVRQSVAPGKRWVWDDWNDDMDDLSSVHTACSVNQTTAQTAPSTLEEQRKFEKMGEKVKLMRRELEERRQEVKALKAKLSRKKLSDERVCMQIEESWRDRLHKRKVSARITTQ